MKTLTASLKSTNTTVLGVLILIGAIVDAATLLADGDPSTMPDWNTVGVAAMGLIGILAKDGSKSSKDVGLEE